MKKISIKISYMGVFLLFACMDYKINLGAMGIKLLYFISVPLIFIATRIKFKGPNKRFDLYIWLWFFSYFLALPHLLSFSDWIVTTIGQFVLFCIYIGVANKCKTISLLEKYEKLFVNSLSVVVALGPIQLLLYYSIGSTWGISHYDSFVGIPRPCSLTAEPDWYGLVCMILALYILFSFTGRSNKFFKSNRTEKIILILSIVGLFISMTRAAWLGFVGAISIYFVIFREKDRKTKIFFWGLGILSVGIVALVVLSFFQPTLFLKIWNRINIFTSLSTDGGAWGSRVKSIEIMNYYIREHFFTGNGVGGMGLISSSPELLAKFGIYHSINSGRGNANIIITNLFDVGVFGTLFFVVSIIVLLMTMYRGYKLFSRNNKNKYTMYFCIIVGMLIDFQFNNGIRQAYVWIIIAFALSLYRLENKAVILSGGKES